MCRWKELCKELDIQPNSEFTAEKQLEVIELLSDYNLSSYSYRLTDNSDLEWTIETDTECGIGRGKSYSEALADIVANMYPTLLEAKQQALVRILEK